MGPIAGQSAVYVIARSRKRAAMARTCHEDLACGTNSRVTEKASAYWDEYYRLGRPELEEPSSFARHCRARIQGDQRLFELGCGNGRDALFFAHHGLHVVACDQSAVAIATLEARPDLGHFRHRPRFIEANFATLPQHHRDEFDFVYSRFSMHATTAATASLALAWTAASLRPGGALLLEARSVRGSLYGRGRAVPGDRDAFIHDGHYRRFLRSEDLCAQLTELGLTIEELIEADGLSVFKDDDPVVIRVVATRALGGSTPKPQFRGNE